MRSVRLSADDLRPLWAGCPLPCEAVTRVFDTSCRHGYLQVIAATRGWSEVRLHYAASVKVELLVKALLSKSRSSSARRSSRILRVRRRTVSNAHTCSRDTSSRVYSSSTRMRKRTRSCSGKQSSSALTPARLYLEVRADWLARPRRLLGESGVSAVWVGAMHYSTGSRLAPIGRSAPHVYASPRPLFCSDPPSRVSVASQSLGEPLHGRDLLGWNHHRSTSDGSQGESLESLSKQRWSR